MDCDICNKDGHIRYSDELDINICDVCILRRQNGSIMFYKGNWWIKGGKN